jgi:predicted transcriptional regulator
LTLPAGSSMEQLFDAKFKQIN